MLVYRITSTKYKDTTLSGIGAEKIGGRWNEVGTRAIYTSANASLALLEYYVHSYNIALLPKQILLAKIEFPDDLIIQELSHLPKGWNHYPYTNTSTKIFTELAKNRDFFALKVPSTIVAIESNFILNPLYKEFGKVEILEYITLPIDTRLKSSSRE